MEKELQRRIASNEAIFREVNEALKAGHWPGEEDSPIAFRCESAPLPARAESHDSRRRGRRGDLRGLPRGGKARRSRACRRGARSKDVLIVLVPTMCAQHEAHL